MSRGFSVGLALFLAALAIGLGFGLVRDFASTERGGTTGTVVGRDLGTNFSKWPTSPPRIKVQLDGGAVVNVTTGSAAGFKDGAKVDLREMITPWGQVWYKLP
jgi:hypothetical protein